MPSEPFLLQDMKYFTHGALHRVLRKYSNLVADYDKISRTYDHYYHYGLGKGLQEYLDVIAVELSSSPKGRWVELAAGTGESTRRIWQLAERSKPISYAAIDMSLEMLTKNERKIRTLFPDDADALSFHCCDALDFLKAREPTSIDAVFCAWGACYMPTSRIRRELRRVLTSDGYIAFIENRSDSLHEIHGLFHQIIRSRPSMLRAVPRIRLPKSGITMASALFPAEIKLLTVSDSSRTHVFESTRQLVRYLLGSSVAAGYIDAIDPEYRSSFLLELAELINDAGVENIPVVHRYAIATGKRYR